MLKSLAKLFNVLEQTQTILKKCKLIGKALQL